MITYRIHQIKDIANTDYAFRSYDSEKFSFLDYACLGEGEFDVTGKTDIEACEIIFYVFNMRKPADFEGHSLSMSDVIELDDGSSRRLYYCDTYGWVQV